MSDFIIIDGKRYFKVPIDGIKYLKGHSSRFGLGIDSSHDSAIVSVYEVTLDDLKDNTPAPADLAPNWTYGELRGALAFGREGARGHFVGVKWLADNMHKHFRLAYTVGKAEIERNAPNIDFGRGLEITSEKKWGFAPSSPKQDRNLKIDEIDSNGHRWQFKCSIIPSTASKKSYSKTNGSVFDDE